MTNVLFICGKARRRSPTAADILSRWPGIHTDFAGLSKDAGEELYLEKLHWADRVFVMENRQKKRLRKRIGRTALGLTIVSLDIADSYQTHDPKLVELLVIKLSHHFGPLP